MLIFCQTFQKHFLSNISKTFCIQDQVRYKCKVKLVEALCILHVCLKGSAIRQAVQFSCSVISYSLQYDGLQHTRLPCPSPAPGAFSNSHPSNQWCHRTISSSVISFSSCLQSFPASGSFPMSQSFTSGGQSIGASASASVFPVNIQEGFSLGWTVLISFQWQCDIVNMF